MSIPSQRTVSGIQAGSSALWMSCTLVALTLLCGCEAIDSTSEVRNAICGNDTLELGEICDGIDLGSEDKSCASFGFPAGELSCNDTCDGFDTSQCSSTQCGNNFQEGIEVQEIIKKKEK